MRIDIITIFPDYFTPLSVSLLGKAASRGDIQLQVHDLRTWAHGVHRAVDDAPFGGGPYARGGPVHAGEGGRMGSLRILGFCLWPVRGDRRARCGRGAGADAGRRGIDR